MGFLPVMEYKTSPSRGMNPEKACEGGGYIGIMEKKMETTIMGYVRVYIGVI